jgi:hypothetical protein
MESCEMISLRQLRLLSEAISDAEDWRGSMIGAAPVEAINEFDKRIKEMRLALKAAHDDRLELLRHAKQQQVSIKTMGEIEIEFPDAFRN